MLGFRLNDYIIHGTRVGHAVTGSGAVERNDHVIAITQSLVESVDSVEIDI